MNNVFAEYPKLKKPFPSQIQYWTCPVTGIKVPKFEEENIAWRHKLLEKAAKDTGLQKDLLVASAQSELFWINAFAWTYHQFDFDPKTGREYPSNRPHRPLITWEIQDLLFENLIDAFKNGHDILIDKSRDMGASWCLLTFFHHIWLFRPQTELREMSRTELYVDGNAKSLFWKHDYINYNLPDWMRPPNIGKKEKNRTKMNMINQLNGSTIAGESTTEFAMSGDRAAALLLDEFAKVKNGNEIRTATEAVSPCRIVNSTPYGAGTEYARWKKSGQIKVFSLPFYEHPEKGRNRMVIKRDTGDYEIVSPWFELKRKKLPPNALAQEVLAEDLQSGNVFFDISNIQKHINAFACEPKNRLNIDFKEGIANDQIFRHIHNRDLSVLNIAFANNNGKLSWWKDLVPDRIKIDREEITVFRPDQSKTYIIGIDTSKGQGASDSVISIKCKQSGEKVGEWTDNNTPPYEFARVVIAIALWCGGAPPRHYPFLKWEMNGPGWDLGRLIVKVFHYPFYYIDEKPGVITSKKGIKYGWHSSKQSKTELLSLYDGVFANGGYINHSKRGLEQAMYYITYPDGSIGPAELSDKKLADRMAHGDIVIADALTIDDKEVPKSKKEKKSYPVNSHGYRRKQRLSKKKKYKLWNKPFNFG